MLPLKGFEASQMSSLAVQLHSCVIHVLMPGINFSNKDFSLGRAVPWSHCCSLWGWLKKDRVWGEGQQEKSHFCYGKTWKKIKQVQATLPYGFSSGPAVWRTSLAPKSWPAMTPQRVWPAPCPSIKVTSQTYRLTAFLRLGRNQSQSIPVHLKTVSN